MKRNKFLTCFFALTICTLFAIAQQKGGLPKGKLFIIGGGDRPPGLMKSLANTAALGTSDFAVVLPMSGAEPDTSFFYFKADWISVSDKPIVNFNFTAKKVNDKNWLDSLKQAKLIFITGGDQDRFMKIVEKSPLYAAIHYAYQHGATIAGTSAGAAVMSKYMITGNAFSDTVYKATFRSLISNNIEIKTGLGLISNAVIDQHFVVRSRYNRLISALALFPSLACIGIDEATAIIVSGNKIKVSGEGQVIVMRNPNQLKITTTKLIKFKDVSFSIFTDGDEFLLNSGK
jgi:cyanophycinase